MTSPGEPADPVDDALADGARADGDPVDGERADGERADGERADGERADGERADGERAEDEQADGQPAPVDALLDALDREGGADGPEVADRIRADQDDLIATPAGTVLVIEGGPGTGKTMTALRRAARLIGECGLPAAGVLVVGPSPAVARRSRAVLTALGHPDAQHHAIGSLLPDVATGREEALHVTRLKGEGRMAGLLRRAVDDRLSRLPADLPAEVTVEGGAVPLDPARLTQVLTTARASRANDTDRRRILRALMVSTARDARLGLAAADEIAGLLWPKFDAAAFLSELFASPVLLSAAAGDEFTAREVEALHRPPAAAVADEVWSDADLPLLDEAGHLVHGGPEGFAHVIVDEAQDLSPMQVRALVRRSATGAMTFVGDLAQSTGPWARDDWHDVLAEVAGGIPHVHRELRFGYRVPRQILELAAELLRTAAPSVQAPATVRDGPAAPAIVPVDPAGRAGVVVAAAAGHAADGRTVAIICPAPCRAEIESRLGAEDVPWRSAGDSGAGITLLTPQEAKGLEFEATVVVEPGFIVDDDPRGHRLLYIALTRSTGHLHLVGAPEDLPVEPGATPALAARPAAEPAPPPLDPAVREAIDAVAHSMAETLLANLTPELWPVALERVVDLITPDPPG